MSITYNKNLTSLLNFLSIGISARSAPQILSIKGGFTFPLLNFLIIGLCNSSRNSLLENFSFLTFSPEVVLSKDLETIEGRPF